ncbi:MAG: DNA primase [SAR324 cluster bacterium]|nr:DNA primase [SAR324 cluster bacterium]
MMYSREFIQQVEQAADIVSVVSERGVALRKTGSTYKALCPFHSEKTASFNVNPQRGFFHCFGCGIGGSAIKFVMEYDKLPFVEALEELADRFSIPLEKTTSSSAKEQSEDRLLTALEHATEFYHLFLTQQSAGETGRQYLQNRSIPLPTWEIFKIGFVPEQWQLLVENLTSRGFSNSELIQAGLAKSSPKSGRPYDTFRNRIIFPIRDIRGRCIAFGGRTIDADQQPKYLNSPETKYYHKSQILYGFFEGREAIKKKRKLILVEGYLDVTRLHQFGFPEAVATCGTSLTADHVRFAQRYVDRVILLLDGDQAGQAAAWRSCPLFLSGRLEASVATLPVGEDPDSFLLTHGGEKFSELLQRDTPVFEYLVQQCLAKHSSNVQGRMKAIEELLPMIGEIFDETIKNMAITHLAELIHLPEATILEKAAKYLRKPHKHDTLENFHSTDSVSIEIQEEKRLLQVLLHFRRFITLAREFLDVNEFQTPHFRQLYKQFLQFSDQEFHTKAIEELEHQIPDLYSEIMKLYMEGMPPEYSEADFKRLIRQIKERILKWQRDEKLASLSDEEKLHANIEFRKKKQALDKIYPHR